MRIGLGYDVHRLIEGRKLIIGGVDIPFEKGLLGHSDADVLSHAIGDAILGAAALGDIGRHFPDTDPEFSGISSLELLSRILQLLIPLNLKLVNLDSTIIAELPKMAPYIEQMRRNLADVIGLSVHSISVKATTTEGLGFTGKGQGIAAKAIVFLQ